MAYSTVSDLMTGDVAISTQVNKTNFIEMASDEIDSELGARYITPVDMSVLADHSRKLLKRCSALISSGRLIMALPIPSEDMSVNAYGKYLLEEGKAILCSIAGGDIELVGAPTDPVYTTAGNAPGIRNYDADSGVDAFYRNVMGGEDIGWLPG